MMLSIFKKCALLWLSFYVILNASAQEILTIESQVTGSKGQPKVITIVPWREPGEPDYYGDDVKDLYQTQQLLKPIRRSSFIQEVKYKSALQKK